MKIVFGCSVVFPWKLISLVALSEGSFSAWWHHRQLDSNSRRKLCRRSGFFFFFLFWVRLVSNGSFHWYVRIRTCVQEWTRHEFESGRGQWKLPLNTDPSLLFYYASVIECDSVWQALLSYLQKSKKSLMCHVIIGWCKCRLLHHALTKIWTLH